MGMETMENNENNGEPQVCIIKIVFPAGSDDEAIAVKKKIGEIMAGTPDAQINFNLIAGRPPVPSR